MVRPKVCLIGRDEAGWAIDEDYRLTKQALEPIVEFTDLQNCEVIHSLWWESLAVIPSAKLFGKKIICHLENPPFHWIKQPLFMAAFRIVGMWVAQSQEARGQAAQLNVKHSFCPYKVDTKVFRPLVTDKIGRAELRRALGLPVDKYLIGNFNRDTEGIDLISPKTQKGPDIFVEIIYALINKGLPVHVLLAGPRRFWVRKRIEAYGIPYSFVGKEASGDDYPANILPREKLNELYNALDLYLVTSRWEGGPHSIMEAPAARCKIVSTRVGLANDILQPECIYDDVKSAVTIIERDIHEGALNGSVEAQYQCVLKNHQVDSVAGAFRNLYAELEKIQPLCGDDEQGADRLAAVISRPGIWDRILKKFNVISGHSLGSGLTVGIWHKFFRPPYGGGNQFMLALKKEFERRGVRVLENVLADGIDAYICNSAWFDKEKFIAHSRKHKIKMIHRIDGPISLYRGTDRRLDDEIFELNARFASVTVIQSLWTLTKLLEMGYKPVDPVVIGNAVEPEFFYPQDTREPLSGRKIRLISTSWSDNPRKGGPVYKWIEDHLDWDRFEYTFVGRSSEKFSRIRQIVPVHSRELGEILREHDIYITASQNDPCSNALIEALSCGLPALFLDSGGHKEIVGYGGLSFSNKEEALSKLDVLARDHQMFRQVISVPSISMIAEKYLALAYSMAKK